MGDQLSAKSVRFRAVIEMSFPDADPRNPMNYDQLIAQWKSALESNPLFNCKDVLIKEIGTFGEDDYDDWRNHKGSYDVSRWGPEGIGRIRGAK